MDGWIDGLIDEKTIMRNEQAKEDDDDDDDDDKG